ncbi:hypothetical protein [Pannonibacter phragmitetus]|uniref:hypothetical protein n=1 Tax=Pannonibacter phragmitetus TaxID=121719 RepID=UPI001364D862|nr:hypothetical protein [Pannonibacter phragmitetus]
MILIKLCMALAAGPEVSAGLQIIDKDQGREMDKLWRNHDKPIAKAVLLWFLCPEREK